MVIINSIPLRLRYRKSSYTIAMMMMVENGFSYSHVLRFLVYQNTALFSSVLRPRSQTWHLNFLDNLIINIMKTSSECILSRLIILTTLTTWTTGITWTTWTTQAL